LPTTPIIPVYNFKGKGLNYFGAVFMVVEADEEKPGVKKITTVLFMITAFLFSLGLMAWVYAASEQKAPNWIKIDDDSAFFKNARRSRPAVTFPHERHQNAYKIHCSECHHDYKNGKNLWKQGDRVQPCRACHKSNTQDKVLSLQNAFHENCKDCHAGLKAESKKAGPTLCAKCHGAGKM
jgi:Class III cytochrome C family